MNNAEYEDWPRGRVVFDRKPERFIVYADRQAFPHAALIRVRFALPESAIFRTDAHYVHARRLPAGHAL